MGKRIEATANLLTTSAVLGDVTNVTRNELKQAVVNGDKTKALVVVDMMDKTLTSVQKRVHDDAYGASQVSASKIDYVAKRIATERKRRELLSPIRRSLRKSDAFVACEKYANSAKPVVTPVAARHASLRNVNNRDTQMKSTNTLPVYPLPCNYHYEPQEVIYIMGGLESPKEQALVKDDIIAKKLVPNTSRLSNLGRYFQQTTQQTIFSQEGSSQVLTLIFPSEYGWSCGERYTFQRTMLKIPCT